MTVRPIESTIEALYDRIKLGIDTAMMMAMMNIAMLNSMSVKPPHARLLPVANVVLIAFDTVGADGEKVEAVGNLLPRIAVKVVSTPLIFADDWRVEIRSLPVRKGPAGLG